MQSNAPFPSASCQTNKQNLNQAPEQKKKGKKEVFMTCHISALHAWRVLLCDSVSVQGSWIVSSEHPAIFALDFKILDNQTISGISLQQLRPLTH